jgi:signal transduction histidine kinase
VSSRFATDAGLLRRVRWRLVAWSSGLTLVVVVVLGAALYASMATSLQSAAMEQLNTQASAVERVLSALGGGDRLLRLGDLPTGVPIGGAVFGGGASGTVAFVIDEEGRLLRPIQREIDSLVDADSFSAALDDGEDVRESIAADGTPVRILSRSLLEGGTTYVVQVIQDRTTEVRTLSALVTVMGFGGLLALLLAVGVGVLYSGRALVPIRESLRRQREFAADASHELRTPLAVVDGSIDQLLKHPERTVGEVRQILVEMGDRVDHLSMLVDELLLLARSDSGAIELRNERIDLADAAAEALRRLRELAATRGVELRLEASPSPVHGDPDRLRQVVGILADNAIRHSPTDGLVTVTVGSGRVARLTVDDAGPGIRDEDLPRIFDRFWRGRDAPPGGVGLGLAIAAWIVERHRGTITAANRAQGGARVTVELPPM